MRKLLIVIGMLVSTSSVAHQAPTGMTYDVWCCNGDGMSGDCAPIKNSAVKSISGGFQVSLDPGDHPMVTKHHDFFVPYQKARMSSDGGYHVCLFPDENTLRCFYRPDMGY